MGCFLITIKYSAMKNDELKYCADHLTCLCFLFCFCVIWFCIACAQYIAPNKTALTDLKSTIEQQKYNGGEVLSAEGARNRDPFQSSGVSSISLRK